ncbi:hypothetical protein Ancab_020164 [Ancistrocladus abbreviatus]
MQGLALLILTISLAAASFSNGIGPQGGAELIGTIEFVDCLQHEKKTGDAFKGPSNGSCFMRTFNEGPLEDTDLQLKGGPSTGFTGWGCLPRGPGVTIDCKLANGEVITRGSGVVDEEGGKFRVSLPKEMTTTFMDGELKEECFARLRSFKDNTSTDAHHHQSRKLQLRINLQPCRSPSVLGGNLHIILLTASPEIRRLRFVETVPAGEVANSAEEGARGIVDAAQHVKDLAEAVQRATSEGTTISLHFMPLEIVCFLLALPLYIIMLE